jgi:hypothetical protein
MSPKPAANASRWRLPILLVILGVLLGVLYYQNMPQTVPAAPPAGAPPPQTVGQPAGQTGTAVQAGKPVMPKGYQPQLAVRDPFAVPPEYLVRTPGGAAAGDKTLPKDAKPVLTGVILAGNVGSAIIQYGTDSRSYRRGDFVGPYQVVAIGNQSVTLQGPEGRLDIGLVGR